MIQKYNLRLSIRFFSLILISYFLVGLQGEAFVNVFAQPNVEERKYFNQRIEFPNYFLAEEWRDTKRSHIPERVISESRKDIELALQSIFSRLIVPIVNADGELKNVRYFEYLKNHISEEVNVLPSGGVVRSAIGYLYSFLYTEIQTKSKLTSSELLKELAADKKDLWGYQIRGVGSDFDVSI